MKQSKHQVMNRKTTLLGPGGLLSKLLIVQARTPGFGLEVCVRARLSEYIYILGLRDMESRHRQSNW